MITGQGPQGIFVTGTDTGVGKTWVSAGLAGALGRRGYRLGVWKPVQSGVELGDPDADSAVLKHWGGVDMDESSIANYTFPQPVSPALAAELARTRVSVQELLEAHPKRHYDYPLWIMEGAGGIAVPLNREEIIAEAAVQLGYPVIVVARPGLGTVNHTVLTVAYARQLGLDVIGVVVNGYRAEDETANPHTSAAPDVSVSTNPEWIEHMSGVRVIGRLPYMGHCPSRDEWIDIIERYIDLDYIIECVGGLS